MHKISNANSVIASRRGDACTSVTEEMPNTLTGKVIGEFLFIYEGKPSYKLVVESNNAKYRVSGYDECKEGDLVTLTKKTAEVGAEKKRIHWYTMEENQQPATKAKATKKATS